jgi:hypothetical protein
VQRTLIGEGAQLLAPNDPLRKPKNAKA